MTEVPPNLNETVGGRYVGIYIGADGSGTITIQMQPGDKPLAAVSEAKEILKHSQSIEYVHAKKPNVTYAYLFGQLSQSLVKATRQMAETVLDQSATEAQRVAAIRQLEGRHETSQWLIRAGYLVTQQDTTIPITGTELDMDGHMVPVLEKAYLPLDVDTLLMQVYGSDIQP